MNSVIQSVARRARKREYIEEEQSGVNWRKKMEIEEGQREEENEAKCEDPPLQVHTSVIGNQAFN